MNLRAAGNELSSRPPKVRPVEIILEAGIILLVGIGLVGLLG